MSYFNKYIPDLNSDVVHKEKNINVVQESMQGRRSQWRLTQVIYWDVFKAIDPV